MEFSEEELASRPESGIAKADIDFLLKNVELQMVGEVPRLPYKFISALGSTVGVYAGTA
jgi:hypothetical protein